MEKQGIRSPIKASEQALNVYLAVCVVVVLLILFNAFQRAGGGTLSGEIYRLSPTAEAIVK